MYDTNVDIDEAIRSAYKLGTVDMNMQVPMSLRKTILEAFQSSEQLEWPISLEYLQKTDLMPKQVSVFLSYLISGKPGEQ